MNGRGVPRARARAHVSLDGIRRMARGCYKGRARGSFRVLVINRPARGVFPFLESDNIYAGAGERKSCFFLEGLGDDG